jgi:hypothetical protein
MEKRRAHRRLAVRGDRHVVMRKEGAHPAAVVIQCGCLQHSYWQRQIPGEKLQAARRDVARIHCRPAAHRRQALGQQRQLVPVRFGSLRRSHRTFAFG